MTANELPELEYYDSYTVIDICSIYCPGVKKTAVVWTTKCQIKARETAIAERLFEAIDKQDWKIIMDLQKELVRGK